MGNVSRAHNLARWAMRKSVRRWLRTGMTPNQLLEALPEYWRFPLEVLPDRALVYNPFTNEYAEVTYSTPSTSAKKIEDIRVITLSDPCLGSYPPGCTTCKKALCGCPIYLGRTAVADARSFNLTISDPMPDSPVLFHDAAEVEDEPIGD